jgi:hypothetical protein
MGEDQFRAKAERIEVGKTDTGKIELNIDFAAHEALLFKMELMLGQTRSKEDIEEIEGLIGYLRERLNNLEFISDSSADLGWRVAFGFSFRPPEREEDVRKTLVRMMNHPVTVLCLAQIIGKGSEFMEILQKKEKELRRQEEEIRKRERALERKEKRQKKNIKMGLHLVNQFYGVANIPNIFSLVDEEVREKLERRQMDVGLELTQTESRVFEGILKAFSDTNYQGDEAISKSSFQIDHLNGRKPGPAYDYIDSIPVLRLTQAQIIELAGFDLAAQRQVDKNEAVKALHQLSTKQFIFYWSRLKKDDKRRPMKEPKTGDYVKEEVVEEGTLLRVKTVLKTVGDGQKKVDFYEIHPSPVILDQVTAKYGGNHFLIMPANWRDEVRALPGKRTSDYTYKFLQWLRVQFEQIRAHNSKQGVKGKPFEVKKTWEELAIILKMPPSMYKKNRKRAFKIIQDGYEAAIKLGYLERVEQDGLYDILHLNRRFYPQPGNLIGSGGAPEGREK